MSPPSDGTWLSFGEEDAVDGDGLDRVDPVCLMDVDPATARHTVEYDGRTFAFCAPSCKTLFLADPSAYLVANPSSLHTPERAVTSAAGSYVLDIEAGTDGEPLTMPSKSG